MKISAVLKKNANTYVHLLLVILRPLPVSKQDAERENLEEIQSALKCGRSPNDPTLTASNLMRATSSKSLNSIKVYVWQPFWSASSNIKEHPKREWLTPRSWCWRRSQKDGRKGSKDEREKENNDVILKFAMLLIHFKKCASSLRLRSCNYSSERISQKKNQPRRNKTHTLSTVVNADGSMTQNCSRGTSRSSLS